MTKLPILVVDDDESLTTMISAYLDAQGYDVTIINDGADALEAVSTGQYPIVITDIYVDRVTGIDILAKARVSRPDTAVILMTARGSVRTTVGAEELGAFDYLAKPFGLAVLLQVVRRAEKSIVVTEPAAHAPAIEDFGEIIGSSAPMVDVFKNIARCSQSEETVLIAGETGVGKELVARAVHDNSRRSKKPFLPVEAGGVTGTLWESEVFGALRGAYTGSTQDRPGVLETAKGGTLFLDEIGEVPLDFQPKLLRFLESKEYRPVGAGTPRKADVRIIAATNRNLESMVGSGTFRQDLFYRLNVLRIEVPPLRERKDDIALLVQWFLRAAAKEASKKLWLEGGALEALQRHSWPGNVRELRNIILRLAVSTPPGPVSESDILRLLGTPGAGSPQDTLAGLERSQILRVLDEVGGNKTRAAEILGIQRRTLYKKLARFQRESTGHSSGPETPQSPQGPEL